jgi:uncharacterized protein
MTVSLQTKREKLESLISDMKSVLVAFSGGVDSTLVLAVAHKVLPGKVLAVTAQSSSVPERELNAAKDLARSIGVEHLIVKTEEMQSADYLANPTNRCYYCKSELYDKLSEVAKQRQLVSIANGINLDDLGDHRPGIHAAKEAGVMSPLAEAGFSKQDVRQLSKILGLATWEKPAMACLSSRVPYGDSISAEKLLMIERAEDYLLSLGFKQLRVRHHGDVARIELERKDFPRFFADDISSKVETKLKEIGYKFVTLDVQGFRSGSLNEARATPAGSMNERYSL